MDCVINKCYNLKLHFNSNPLEDFSNHIGL